MKKLIALSLALVMALAMVACGEDNSTSTTTTGNKPEPFATTTAPAPEIKVPESALALLKEIWANVPEDSKFFVGGGDYDNMVDGDAASVTNESYMSAAMHMSENTIASVDEVASLIHGMNQNNMTVGALHLKEGTNVASLAENIKNDLLGVHWMCGFPETLMVASVGDYMLFVFGLGDNVTLIQNQMTALYPDTVIHATAAFE